MTQSEHDRQSMPAQSPALNAFVCLHGTPTDWPETSELEGMPFGVKDVIDVQGCPTKGGGTELPTKLATSDASAVRLLRQAGARPVGKTITCEMAGPDPSPTLNPWSHDRTPGGSSSGSAVAVASSMVPFALGTQTGGSTLRPAAYNGVAGYKPSHGWIPTEGVLPLAESLDTVGVIARSAALLSTVASVLTRTAVGEADFNLKVGRQWMVGRTSHEVASHLDGVFAQIGQELELDDAAGIDEDVLRAYSQAHSTISAFEAARNHGPLLRKAGGFLGPMLRAYLERGREISHASYREACAVRDVARDRFSLDIGEGNILLMPSVPSEAPADLASTGDPSYQTWTQAGLPAVTLPCGLSHAGLPIGVQLVAPRGEDPRLLHAATVLERILPPMPTPPPVPFDVVELNTARWATRQRRSFQMRGW